MKSSLPVPAIELIEKGIWKGEKLVVLKTPGSLSNKDVSAISELCKSKPQHAADAPAVCTMVHAAGAS